MKRLYLFLLVTMVNTGLAAQDTAIIIKGTIITDSGYAPVAHAVIKAKSADNSSAFTYTFSNEKGDYTLYIEHPPDSLVLEISHVGYITSTQRLYIGKTLSLRNNVRLVSSYKGLPSITVSAIHRSTQKKDTITFNAAAYQSADQANIGDLLKKVPGFTVGSDGRLSFNGQAIDRVLIESDDLYDHDYGSMIINVSPGDIEKLDVIRHYKDKSDLSKKMTSGNEQVLNLTFKKKKTLRIYGNATATGGPDHKYDNKIDAVGLLRNAKFVAFSNVNAVGDLCDNLFARSAAQPASENNDFDPLSTAPASFVNPEVVSSQLLGNDRFTTNNSRITGTNLLYSFTPEIKVKASLQLGGENYRQYQSASQQYFALDPEVVYNQNDSIHINHLYTNLTTELNYSTKERFQFVYKFRYRGIRTDQTTDEILNNNPNTQNSLQKNSTFSNNFKSTCILNNKSLISLSAYVDRRSLPEGFHLSPFEYETAFSYTGYYSQLSQTIDHTSTRYGTTLEYAIKSSAGLLKIDGNYTGSTESLTARVALFNRIDSTMNILPENTDYEQHRFRPTITYIAKNIGPLLISSSAGLDYYHLALSHRPLQGVNENNRLSPAYDLSATYKISDASQLSFNFVLNSSPPEIRPLLKGYLISDFHSLITGEMPPRITNGRSITISYFYQDLVRKKLLFLANIISRSDQSPYINNLQYQGAYTLDNYLEGSKQHDLIVCYARIEKFLPLLRSRLTLDLSAAFSAKWNAVDSISAKYTLHTQAFNLQYYSDFDGWFDLEWKVSYNRYTQDISNSSGNRNTSFIFLISPLVKVGQKLTFRIDWNYLTTRINSNPHQNCRLVDVSGQYQLIKEKLQLKLRVRNLFDQTSFANNYINSFFTNSSYFTLVRSAIIGLSYRF